MERNSRYEAIEQPSLTELTLRVANTDSLEIAAEISGYQISIQNLIDTLNVVVDYIQEYGGSCKYCGGVTRHEKGCRFARMPLTKVQRG
jgi:hypothetical protein